MTKNSEHTSNLGDATIDFGFVAVNLDAQLDERREHEARIELEVDESVLEIDGNYYNP